MKLLIDASNLIAGGGKTHLLELLRHGDVHGSGFNSVTVFGHEHVLKEIPERPWLRKISPFLFRYGYIGRFVWQKTGRSPVNDGIWFVPGAGSAPGRFVTMCQNLLPLEKTERDRYFFSLKWLRLILLGWVHRSAFRKAAGVIFFNQYSLNTLKEDDRNRIRDIAFIPHGVSDKFNTTQSHAEDATFKLIYVSTVEEYKHHWRIADVIEKLINEGYDISIDFIGSANPKTLKKLHPFLSDKIRYRGSVPYMNLPEFYSKADAFIFGSTCETFGMVLLEAMASGLPVICSNHSSMPETLQGNALYFDPLNSDDTERVIRFAYNNPAVLQELISKGRNHVKQFTWNDTVARTLKFLAKCAINPEVDNSKTNGCATVRSEFLRSN